ncbi:30S ribosomal protein S15 [Patescibacteria group bacterium]|nr:30S ribosomal protein S15 [Patescibacteria group bacterium]
MLKIDEKAKIVSERKRHPADTGSDEVQIGLLSEEITGLLAHLKKHPKDLHSKRGLLKMVSTRRKLLKHLKKDDEKRYNKTIKAVGLKK